MESLLLQRNIGKISPVEFEQIITESLYYNLDALDFPRFSQQRSKSSINALDFDKEQYRFLLSGGADSSIKLWDTNSTSSKIPCLAELNKSSGGHEFGVTCLQWWPFDSGMFLSSSYDSTLRLWDTNSLEEAYCFSLDSKVNCFDISPFKEVSLVATGTDSSHVRILDLRTTSSSHTLVGHNGSILSTKWSSGDGNILATGSSEGEILVWDIRRTRSCVAQLDLYRTDIHQPKPKNLSKKGGVLKTDVKAHARAVNGLCWTSDGSSLISTSNDEKIRVWDMTVDGGVNSMLNFGPFIRNKFMNKKDIVLSPFHETEIQYLWYPSDNGEILIMRLIDGKLIARLRRNLKEASRNCSLCYAGNNSATYYSGTVDGKIHVWGPKEEHTNDDEDLEL